jgi:signal transduction histidine kinase
LATASPFDAALRDVLEALHTATREIVVEAARDPAALARRSADLALRLTRSAHATVTFADRDFSAGRERPRGAAMSAAMRVELRTPRGGRLGAISVARTSEYTDNERAALEVFAAQVSLGLALAERWDERAESIERVERAHEQAVQVLQSVSSHAAQGQNLNDFYRRLARTVGELVGANRVLFWRLGDDHMLAPMPGGYRIDQSILSRLRPTRCEPGRDDLASRVVFNDFVFRASATDEPPEYAYVLEVLRVSSAISVPWRAGEQRLGLVAAYDSTRPGGFSREDTWVLQKAGLAAGLVTRLWQSQEDLRRSVERLTKVDSARQLLLKNMTTVVEKERKRFVNELHDDALQKLTAAELQAARLQGGAAADAATLDKLRTLLETTETALRRLVFDVRPPSLETPDGLAQSIRERVAMLAAAGIQADVELDLPPEMSADMRTLVFRQVAEAIGNAERHSQATHVNVSLKLHEGGLLGVVRDNGKGFEVADRSNLPGHLGLLALRERALMAGGRYNIESRPGKGTHVEFWIPLDQ